MDEPSKMYSLVLDKDGDIWRKGRTRWTCEAEVDGRRVTRVGRLPWYALVTQYGPLTLVREGMTAPKPLENMVGPEIAYLALVRKYGKPGPRTKRIALEPPVADDGETDCWTHAWEVARRLKATYVEGLCMRPGATGPSFHAWVEESNPLTGRTLVETTPGYEACTEYLGIAVDCKPGGLVETITKDWTIRSSVIQSALASGGTPQQVLNAVRSA